MGTSTTRSPSAIVSLCAPLHRIKTKQDDFQSVFRERVEIFFHFGNFIVILLSIQIQVFENDKIEDHPSLNLISFSKFLEKR